MLATVEAVFRGRDQSPAARPPSSNISEPFSLSRITTTCKSTSRLREILSKQLNLHPEHRHPISPSCPAKLGGSSLLPEHPRDVEPRLTHTFDAYRTVNTQAIPIQRDCVCSPALHERVLHHHVLRPGMRELSFTKIGPTSVSSNSSTAAAGSKQLSWYTRTTAACEHSCRARLVATPLVAREVNRKL